LGDKWLKVDVVEKFIDFQTIFSFLVMYLLKKMLMEKVISWTEGNYTFEVNIIIKTKVSVGSDDQCLAVGLDVSINIQILWKVYA